MVPYEPSQFEQCALASGLVRQGQLDEARSAILGASSGVSEPRPPDDRQLADRLIELGVLNAWQAKQLLEGRTKFSLGPYQILDSIGQGAMGQIFKAKHENAGDEQVVAIKVLPRDKSTPEAIANFKHEIRALASLHHPRLVAALDAGEDGSVHYLVTEYVPGMDLRKLVRQNGPLGMSAAASIISQVAEGLDCAHAKGIIHRDVKPGNVLVTPEGEAKLSDLGLSGPLDSAAERDPRYGKVVGTADYLSPDQVRDPWHPAPSWDIYSLGCTLYYAVTGQVPFPGGTTVEKARAHCEMRPIDPRRFNSQLTAAFVSVLADMMAKEPAQRVASAREVRDRLATFILPDRGGRGRVPLPRFIGVPAIEPAAPPVVALSSPNDDQSSSIEMEIAVSSNVTSVVLPLTIFVLTPVVIIGAAMLLWWLAKALFF